MLADLGESVDCKQCDDKFTTDEAGHHSPPVRLPARGHHHANLAEALRTGERRVVFTGTSQLPSQIRARVPRGEMTDKESFLLQCWTLVTNSRQCIGQNPRQGWGQCS